MSNYDKYESVIKLWGSLESYIDYIAVENKIAITAISYDYDIPTQERNEMIENLQELAEYLEKFSRYF